MEDILLRSLSNVDLDWLLAQGVRSQLTANTELITPGQPQTHLYVLVEGQLAVQLAWADRQNAKGSDATDRLTAGEMAGISGLLGTEPLAHVSVLKGAQVLSIELAALHLKLQQDLDFAAHLYRCVAVVLSHRLRRLFEYQGSIRAMQPGQVRQVLSVFGELQDSDIDWLVSFGMVHELGPEQTLLRAGRPVDAFYIVLDGCLEITAPPTGITPIQLCFANLNLPPSQWIALTTISQGALPGIISFVDFSPLPVTIRTTTHCRLLAVPCDMLVTKLHVDRGFAARFYRIIAVQILELMQAIRDRLRDRHGIDAKAAAPPRAAIANFSTADTQAGPEGDTDQTLDLEALQTLSEGGAKFNWMLQQLGGGYG
ncbi:cyclic nucleotide-binding domain-containing protein [Nodosilinea sp. P-1105]|uniref:cyclic nucleotide-binding domain-containing protein n=1 Tax=Nodosilinea sp. P-1105 TaxID=2546229 RepID=UPI00146C384F|nr:cyclic nucleotide-binding domain-containing protein [Nodosilinea sp. P-1105]NMF84252.1 cyclic nucleotide-binding domain-containing protein [Nodosilinea sp. P-1105]